MNDLERGREMVQGLRDEIDTPYPDFYIGVDVMRDVLAYISHLEAIEQAARELLDTPYIPYGNRLAVINKVRQALEEGGE